MRIAGRSFIVPPESVPSFPLGASPSAPFPLLWALPCQLSAISPDPDKTSTRIAPRPRASFSRLTR